MKKMLSEDRCVFLTWLAKLFYPRNGINVHKQTTSLLLMGGVVWCVSIGNVNAGLRCEEWEGDDRVDVIPCQSYVYYTACNVVMSKVLGQSRSIRHNLLFALMHHNILKPFSFKYSMMWAEKKDCEFCSVCSHVDMTWGDNKAENVCNNIYNNLWQ